MNFEIGMPHLIYNGIDPIWLSKTLADLHWGFLRGISSINDKNQRLYASVFALEIDFGKGQNAFREFDNIDIQSKIYKFNNLIYRSTHSIACTDNVSTAIIDTVFVKKDLNSGVLIKESPVSSPEEFSITESISLKEHKELKKKFSTIEAKELYNELVFSPEAYFNGVKILYFANYLNLVFLSEYQTYRKILDPIKKINIFYFKNISPTDRVYGLTVKNGDFYETTLMSNDSVISFCKILR